MKGGPTAAAAGLLVLVLAGGCANLRSVRLYFPEGAGFEAASPRLYVDPALSPAQRTRLLENISAGRERVAAFYGGVTADPTFVACASMDCYRRFGGIGGKGVFYWHAILLSPEGQSPAVISHEWSHAELSARVGKSRTVYAVPQWFDEGVAVLLSGDPEYTGERWLAATDNGTKIPPLRDLETLRGWLRATGEGGVRKQSTYGTARREVERWHAAAGREGFLRLLRAVGDGDDFTCAYERARSEGLPGTPRPAAGTRVPGECSTWNVPRPEDLP